MRFALRACLFLLLALVPSRLLTQTATPTPPPLTFGEVVRETLSEGEEITYRFEMPQDRDVVISVKADKVVLPHYCIERTDGGGTRRECPRFGGSGSDQPVSRSLYFAADDSPNTPQVVDVSIVRPLEGEARLTMRAYPVMPRPITLTKALFDQTGDPDLPYQVYTIQVDPALPFTVSISDTEPDGHYLWVANQPYRQGFITPTTEPRLTPASLDGASIEGGETLQAMSLIYLGGEDFRVLVEATAAYSVYSQQAAYHPFTTEGPISSGLGFRDPIAVFRLTNEPGIRTRIHLDMVQGAGAVAQVYTTEEPLGQGLALGETHNPDAQFPLSNILEVPPSSGPIILVLQLPNGYSRDWLRVLISWEPKTAG
jgi:hypothetical protein